jgi:hypothetical protein
MSPVKRRLSYLLAGLVGLYVICGVIALAITMREANTGRALLVELQRLSGGAAADNLASVAAQYHGTIPAGGCGAETCTAKFKLNNNSLHLLRLVPMTVLAAEITTRKSASADVHVTLSVIRGDYPASGAVVAIASLTQLSGGGEFPFGVGFQGKSPTKGYAHVTPQASPEQRSLAFNFDLSCLYRPGGCKDAAALAPAWWLSFQNRPKLPPPE